MNAVRNFEVFRKSYQSPYTMSKYRGKIFTVLTMKNYMRCIFNLK